MGALELNWPPWVTATGILVGAALAGLVVHRVVFALAKRIARRTDLTTDDLVIAHVRGPARLLLPLLAVMTVLPEVRQYVDSEGELLGRTLSVLLIASAAWLVVGLLNAAEGHVRRTWRLDVADNLEARRVQTRTRVLKRALVVLVVVVALGAALMTFPRVRQLGASLLASAGIAGLAIGIAARPVLENLIAGVQLALTQPVRLDDVVIVGGEWGRIEEITATYVVVKIWDERRLVVPFSKFISEPFQNWTRTTADLLGTASIHADYTVPVQAVRERLHAFLETEEDWDGRVWNLQVIDATDRTVELRALVSAADAGKAWNLRCRVREELIGFLQREHPGSLPRARVELDREAPEPG